ncbi:reverse transcriptase domain-containing protein [Tanacetum coccineum]
MWLVYCSSTVTKPPPDHRSMTVNGGGQQWSTVANHCEPPPDHHRSTVFDIEIHDKKGAENLAADHLSRLEYPYKGDLVKMEMNDNFPHESLNMIDLNDDNERPWFADIANNLVGNGIKFMGSFLSSRGSKYILVAVDYVSKWFEAKALPTNDARVVVKFLKQLFSRFRTPRAIISDRERTVGEHRAKWADKLDDALWA